MIESMIMDYLHGHRRLVIPELGAFLKKEEGETIFVPFLNKDDGVLTELVCRTYGTSSAEAEGIIVRYVEEIRRTIASAGVYRFTPLGVLKKDGNGVLYLDAAGPDPVVRETLVEEVVAPDPAPVLRTERESAARATPEPEDSRIVAESLEAPKTLNDLIRERQEQQEPAQTLHQRAVETIGESKPIKKPAESPHSHPQQHPKPVVPRPTAQPHSPKPSFVPAKRAKRGDIVLIAAVVVAILAVAAMIYGYAVTELPLFDLK
jgi:hypothetical protein